MNKRGKVDMHIHTTASDGSWLPEKVARMASESGVEFMSVTDHDAVGNVETTSEFARDFGMKFVSGVEISSTAGEEMIHILGYGIDVQNQGLKDLLKENSYLMNKKDDNLIKRLIARGYNLDYSDYEKYEHNATRGGWKALSYLIDAGLCVDIKDFFTNLFPRESLDSYPVFSSPEEVIGVIKSAGGVPVLAHPYYEPTDETVDARLGRFMEHGFEGVECYHPNHPAGISMECAKWCKNNEFIITAGSDSHGDFIRSRKIGTPEVNYDQVKLGRIEEMFI